MLTTGSPFGKELEGQAQGRRRRGVGKADFQAKGVGVPAPGACFSNLLDLLPGRTWAGPSTRP